MEVLVILYVITVMALASDIAGLSEALEFWKG